MIEALFQLIFNIFFFLVGIIGSIIIYPIQFALVTIFPSLGSFITMFLTFFNQYVFPMVGFIKEFLIDVVGINRDLFSILINFMLLRWGIAPAIRGIKLLVNIWKIKSGGATK